MTRPCESAAAEANWVSLKSEMEEMTGSARASSRQTTTFAWSRKRRMVPSAWSVIAPMGRSEKQRVLEPSAGLKR